MTQLKVNNKILAKLREFRKGDDVEEFLATQFRQVMRALENQTVDIDSTDLSGESTVYAESSSSGSFTTTVAADVSNLTLDFVGTGGIIVIGLLGASSSDAYVHVDNSGTNAFIKVQLIKDAAVTDSVFMTTTTAGTTLVAMDLPPSSFSFRDTSRTTGKRTYKIHVGSVNGNATFQNIKLFAQEIF